MYSEICVPTILNICMTREIVIVSVIKMDVFIQAMLHYIVNIPHSNNDFSVYVRTCMHTKDIQCVLYVTFKSTCITKMIHSYV